MRPASLILLLFLSVSAQAVRPIYYYPSLIRGTQMLWQHGQEGNPNSAVQFVGPYGLHPVAVAKFGYPVEAFQDSALSFHVAEHLWLDYYCVMGDSALADLALMLGPAYVRRQNETELALQCLTVEQAKSNPSLAIRASYDSPISAQKREEGPNLASIPQFERYTVRPGDSLWKIHQRFPQHSLASLIEANGGKETIYVGQILQIPL